ncbi:hypothetical protein ACI7YT_01575 [Microbacterium sp. M]|uniref:hypothetical protein n=1 Tax=Microbacterium sp. M TaxID=3377125 RepID=UPI00386C88CD
MIDVDPAGSAVGVRRRTGIVGGALLVASALMTLALRSLPGVGFGLFSIPDLLFAAGAVIFAIGLGRAGSVTARRPLGTFALVTLAVWILLSPLFLRLSAPASAEDISDGLIMFAGMLSVTLEVVSLALAIIAATQIARIGAVPRPWNRAPLWALVAVAVVRLLRSAFLFGAYSLSQETLVLLDSLGGLIEAAAVGFLGVVAIVVAVRPVPGSTTVYSSTA